MSEPNGVMFQFFEWNLANDGMLWKTLALTAKDLRAKGMTAIWFPPPTKGHAGDNDVGYGAYDLYDLGEFDQKGSVRTKYGTRDELLAAIEAVQSHGMDAYLDCVMNHRMGGDELEDVTVVEINPSNRLEAVSDPYVIRAWSRYTFPGRNKKYSEFVWTHEQFDAFGFDDNQKDVAGRIYRVADRSFSDEVDHEYGNFDYLMGANVDYARNEVREEMVRWGAVAFGNHQGSRTSHRRGKARVEHVRERVAHARSRVETGSRNFCGRRILVAVNRSARRVFERD